MHRRRWHSARGSPRSDGQEEQSRSTTLDCSTPQGFAATENDCDDFNAAVLPGAMERCNAKDDDCDGMVDEGLSGASTWPDLDGDGYGDRRGTMTTGCSASGRASNDQDCDDRDPKIRPGAAEVCNLRDDDCNGRIDENVRVRCGTGWCEALGITCDPMSCQPRRPLVERCNLHGQEEQSRKRGEGSSAAPVGEAEHGRSGEGRTGAEDESARRQTDVGRGGARGDDETMPAACPWGRCVVWRRIRAWCR